MDRSERQAIVVIHGIGDHRPMDTLRRFVRGLGLGPYYNKPDRVSDSTELRRLSLPRTRHRPATDFFELYWAHQMAPGKFRQTVVWSCRLAFSKGVSTTPQALRVWLSTLRVFTLVAGMGALAILMTLLVAAARLLLDLSIPQPATRLALFGAFSALVLGLIINVVAGEFVRRSVADAARYLTPKPQSMAGRNAVRLAGMELIRRLHHEGTYVRIVVVGHSLGSVIAYDILRQLYDEFRHPRALCWGPQPEADEFSTRIDTLGSSPARKDIEAFRDAQLRLWRENRERGVPWLITDLITMGSPLTHARLLLDQGEFSLKERQEEREYPTCPPQGDEGNRVLYSTIYRERETVRNLEVANTAAVFATTRWTNLYFPVRKLVLGDLVGGPVAPLFGPGVLDLPVARLNDATHERWRAVFPVPHSDYWRPGTPVTGRSRHERNAARTQTGVSDALSITRHTLALDLYRGKRWPSAASDLTLDANPVSPEPESSD